MSRIEEKLEARQEAKDKLERGSMGGTRGNSAKPWSASVEVSELKHFWGSPSGGTAGAQLVPSRRLLVQRLGSSSAPHGPPELFRVLYVLSSQASTTAASENCMDLC